MFVTKVYCLFSHVPPHPLTPKSDAHLVLLTTSSPRLVRSLDHYQNNCNDHQLGLLTIKRILLASILENV